MGIIRYKDIAYGGGSSVTEGYYKVADGKFYEHFDGTTYSDEITGEDGILYLDLSTNNLYRWSTGASLFVLVGKSTLASLNDTNISSPTDGQALEYNGTSSKWVNVAKKAADTPTFTEATGTRSNIVGSGETMATILGKIKRWFADLKDLAFIGKDGASSTKYLRGDGTWQAFPSIPAAQVQSDWTQTTTTAVDYIKNKPNLATVATSGSYNDLSNKPTIPSYSVVSTSANGLAPKVTDTSKFLKGDGTWATPTDTNTTYTLSADTTNNKIKLTPSSGSAQSITVPYATSAGSATDSTKLPLAGGTLTGTLTSQNIIPNGTSYDLGSTSKWFRRLYASAVRLCQTNGRIGIIYTNDALTADRTYTLPDSSGTLATQEYVSTNYGTITTGTITKASRITSGTLDNTQCQKIGKMVVASGRIYSMSVSASGDFFQIPTGFRPTNGAIGMGYIKIGSTFNPCPCSISTNGVVGIYWSASQTTDQVFFFAVYPIS